MHQESNRAGPIGVGTLTVGGRELSVCLMAPRTERAIWAELKDVAAGDGDAFTRAAPALDRLRQERNDADWARLAQTCAFAVVADLPPSDELIVQERRRNPRVLARELYLRAKPCQPGLDPKEVEALVTEATVADAQYDLDELLKTLAEAAPAPAPPSAIDATVAENDRLLNVPGTVVIGDRRLSVASLSLREERALAVELAGVVEDQGDALARVAPAVKRLEAERRPAERAVLVQAACQAVATGAPVGPDALDKARRTNPAVLARELYRRGRKADPRLDLRELEAVVTAANVGDLWGQLDRALTGEGDAAKK